ncbi:MAG: archease [Candidatus Nanoarchaeia archaeon]|nr:archease [Candidatus Nanoarchaeia archaeon]
MKFKFLEKIATADIAFESYGKTLRELFENTALAFADVTADLKSVKAKTKKIIRLENEDSEQLLFDFIGELIYIKDADYFIFKEFYIKLKEGKLIAECYGEKINSKKHNLRNDVKAITYHMYKISKTKSGYKAMIVLDV